MFQKGHKGLKPVGAISAKSRAWEELGEYIGSAGAQRYMDALKALEDDKFIEKFTYVLEFFKPKLARSEVTGKDGERLFPKPILDVKRALPENDSNGQDIKLICKD